MYVHILMLFKLNSSRGVAIAFSSGRGYIVIVLKGERLHLEDSK